MPIDVRWDNPQKTIIRYEFTSEWTWAEFNEALTQAYAMIATVPHQVDAIANFARSIRLPNGAAQQEHRPYLKEPPNTGLLVLTNTGAFIQTLLVVFGRLYPTLRDNIRVAGTLEDARAVISDQSPPASESPTAG